MSDMTEREQDAAVIAAYDGAIEESARPNWTFAMGMEYANARNNRRNIYQCAAAMRRTIDRLQADNARLRAALDKVGAIVDTCESNKRTGVGHYGRNGGYGSAVADIAEVIRAILDGAK